MATIVFESFMPARCWIPPEMPTAIEGDYPAAAPGGNVAAFLARS
jgi:hypothetical protein